MRYIIVVFSLLIFASCNTKIPTAPEISFADNMVVAHRGAWKSQNLPENSIASLQYAIQLKCTGSEFDIRMTSDNVLIVTHDNDYHNLIINDHTYEELSKFKLENGETLPTLRQMILAGMKNNTSTGLVCEIKPSKSKERNEKMTIKVLDLISELNAEAYIHSIISFDYNILKKVKELNPKIKTQYLNGDKAPKELASDGISGLDYHVNKFFKNPNWIKEAKTLGLSLNAWTANKQEDLDLFLDNDFDYITTNEPELLFERIEKSPTNKGYILVWSDEFNNNGKPNPKKWNYTYGFLANQEEQYYTDNIQNVRVEKGNLVIEAHKEKIKNDKYQDKELLQKSWMKYAAEIDSAKYTSARINTKNLASWTYGKITVRAKLPKGKGMWPAIWMLGSNIDSVKWPHCGEIDIMEHVGFEPDSIYGTIHTTNYNHMKNTEKGKAIYVEDVYNEYHLYSIEWTPETLDFMVDGIVYNHIQNEHKSNAEWPFDKDFYLILNVAVGGTWGGLKGVDDSIFPQHMAVDYVRVFQENK